MWNGRRPRRSLPAALAPTRSAAAQPSDADESGSLPSREERRQVVSSGELLAPGSLIAGRYQVSSLLGAGGMGAVFAAKNLVLDSAVAIKVLRGDVADDKGGAERLIREARASAQISHPNVVRVFDAGRLESGAPFVVMERLFGTDLEQLLRARGPLAPERAARYLIEACRGVAAAHDLGFVHRDLKPANLFLTDGDAEAACIKVLDFGVSKVRAQNDAERSDLTRDGTLVGSPRYMSPEQLRSSRDVDHRADIWALGVTLFHLVTGRHAFDAPNLPALAMAIAGDVPGSRAEGEALPAPLRRIVQRCLEKDPNRRFGSVRELERALRGYVEGAGPRRQRRVLMVAAGLALVLLAFLVWRSGAAPKASLEAASRPTLATPQKAPIETRAALSPAEPEAPANAPQPSSTPPAAAGDAPVSKAPKPVARAARAPSKRAPAQPAERVKPEAIDGMTLRDQSAVYDRK